MTANNRLREASPDTVYPDPTFIDVGGMNNAKYRDVMRFDLSEYPDSTNVSNAILSLYWYYPANTRPEDTVIEVYRPASSWNSSNVSWNKKDKDVSWKNAGADWYDKNGVAQGSTPYATITIKGSTLPDNKYYELDVTDLVKEYVSGKYPNTGFLIKARTENNDYIAFYSLKDEARKPLFRVEVEQPVPEPSDPEPTDPEPVDPETPEPETEPLVYLMIQFASKADATAKVEAVKAIVGDKPIKILTEA